VLQADATCLQAVDEALQLVDACLHAALIRLSDFVSFHRLTKHAYLTIGELVT
jgi:hypothetical protein